MRMKRFNLVLDEKLLEEARKKVGDKTYSDTVNRALREMLRIEILRQGLDRLTDDMWLPGYVEEYGPNPPLPKTEARARRSAETVRAPRRTR